MRAARSVTTLKERVGARREGRRKPRRRAMAHVDGNVDDRPLPTFEYLRVQQAPRCLDYVHGINHPVAILRI